MRHNLQNFDKELFAKAMTCNAYSHNQHKSLLLVFAPWMMSHNRKAQVTLSAVVACSVVLAHFAHQHLCILVLAPLSLTEVQVMGLESIPLLHILTDEIFVDKTLCRILKMSTFEVKSYPDMHSIYSFSAVVKGIQGTTKELFPNI